MNCQRARETFPELLDSRTPATAQLEARAHLAGCPDCQKEFSALSQTLSALDVMSTPPPSPRLRQNFYAMLEEEKHSAESVRAASERQQRARRTSLWRWIFVPLGAAAMLGGGFIAGQRSTAPAVATTTSENTELRHEVRDLQAQVKDMKGLQAQVNDMKDLMVRTLVAQTQKPATDRFNRVFASATLESADDTAVNDLLTALAVDNSANVRLRALQGLARHSDKQVVRAVVLASLNREENPLVQISMIDFLATARDLEARPAIEKISSSETADKNVRDAARQALLQF